MPPADEHVDLAFPDSVCFGCSHSSADGLRLTFRRDGEVVTAVHRVAARHQGAPDIAHGGIVATLLDEISCAAVAFVHDVYVVTGELTVRYEAPVPVSVPLHLEARVTSQAHPKYAVVEGRVQRDGTVLARSTGKFFYQERLEPAP
jgi:acyl-coenzyme A thioesterase PaaI-like protein